MKKKCNLLIKNIIDSNLNFTIRLMSKLYESVSLESTKLGSSSYNQEVSATTNQESCFHHHEDDSNTTCQAINSLNTSSEIPEEAAFIGTIDDAKKHADWLIHNEHITKGYRINHSSYKVLAESCFKVHNETTNVWSHLLGALLFTVLLIIMTRSSSTGSMRWFAGSSVVGGSFVVGGSETTDHLMLALQDTVIDMCHGIDDIKAKWSNLSVNSIIEDMRSLETRFRAEIILIADNQLEQLA